MEEQAREQPLALAFQQEEARQPQAQALAGEIAAAQAALPRYEALEAKGKELARASQEKEEKQAAILRAQSNLETLQARLGAMEEEQANLEDAPAQRELLAARQQQQHRQRDQFKELDVALRDCKGLAQALAAARKAYREAAQREQSLGAESQRLSRAFLDAQAGLLALGLAPGVPCPVAPEHPSPAQPPPQAPTQQEVEQAQASHDQALAQARRLSEEAAAANTRWEGREREALRQGEALLGPVDRDQLPRRMLEGAKALQEAMESTAELASRSGGYCRTELAQLLPKQRQGMAEAQAPVQARNRFRLGAREAGSGEWSFCPVAPHGRGPAPSPAEQLQKPAGCRPGPAGLPKPHGRASGRSLCPAAGKQPPGPGGPSLWEELPGQAGAGGLAQACVPA